jgi:hypothetical protein
MTTFRRAIPDFQLANPLYAGATIAIYTVDDDGVNTADLATVYASPRGAQTLSNPQVLDGDGKWAAPVYIDGPVVIEATGASIGSHETGVIIPLGIWRGDWVTATVYVAGDYVTDGDLDFPDVYAVTDLYTSGATLLDDLAAEHLVLIIAGSVLADMRDAGEEFATFYLGPKAVLPSVDNQGNALVVGALIFYTPTGVLRAYDGADWVSPSVAAHSHPQSDIDNLETDLAALAAVDDTKLNKDGAKAITGETTFDERPLFDGKTPWDDGNLVPAWHGGVELVLSGSIQMQPRDGGWIIIDGISRKLTSVLTLSSLLFTADVTMYVYATWTGTAVSYAVSSTGYARQTNGVVTKSSDAAQTLVGAVHKSGFSFADVGSSRLVLSWFQRKRRLGFQAVIAGGSTTVYYSAIGATIKAIAWAGSEINLSLLGVITTTGTPSPASCNAAILANGTLVANASTEITCRVSERQTVAINGVYTASTEGLITFSGAAGTNGAGNVAGLNARLTADLPAY